jgi:hypothetical protein
MQVQLAKSDETPNNDETRFEVTQMRHNHQHDLAGQVIARTLEPA